MNSRLCLIVLIAPLALIPVGCGDVFDAGPMSYIPSERLSELKEAPLREAVTKGLADLYGPEPRIIKVPKDSGYFAKGGLRLASHLADGDKKGAPIHGETIVDGAVVKVKQQGGYGLYRKHCLQCHGVSGAGDGPLATFVFPRPRDYRPGKFKFTSTPNGGKPSREDMRRTLKNGLHGTSMPAFEAILSDDEIEQLIDYTVFLSIRGETELVMIDEGLSSGELPPEMAQGFSQAVFQKWKDAEEQVVNPPVARIESSRESVLRGRDMFLGRNTTGGKVNCTSCHGTDAKGNGPSFVSMEVYNRVVFGSKINKQFKLVPGEYTILQTLIDLEAKKAETSWTSLQAAVQKDAEITGKEPIDEIIAKTGYSEASWGKVSTFPELFQNLMTDLEDKTLVSHSIGMHPVYHAEIDIAAAKLWNDSLDEWNNPLRPNNLNRGVYKGGRRPLDLYWRIAKGINGAKMPSHYPALDAERIWDLVNFILALPSEPGLLESVEPSATPPAVAQRDGHESKSSAPSFVP